MSAAGFRGKCAVCGKRRILSWIVVPAWGKICRVCEEKKSVAIALTAFREAKKRLADAKARLAEVR
jgi:hypothetical protein